MSHTTPLAKLMVRGQKSVDPRNTPMEAFELYSIPAYDKGQPDMVVGSEVGSTKKVIEPGDVLLSRIVPHIRRAWVVPASNGRRQIASGEWIVFRHAKMYPPYLRHLVMSDSFHAQFMNTVAGVGGSLVRARPENVGRIEITLPTLSEQKRIADILDKAESIRHKRQLNVRTVDELIHSTFMRIVGPDAQGYCDWPIREIQDLASCEPGSMRTGPFGSTLKHSEFVDEGVAVLGIDNAVKNQFAWDQRRFITKEKYEELKRYTVHPGDVLITIMATTGRSAVVPEDIPVAINTKHLACITLARTKAEPEFVSNAIHRHPEVLKQLGASGRGAIMTGLNLGIIKKIGIPTPPIEVQRQFTNVLEECRNLQMRLQHASIESDNLFNSLVQSAFKGDL